MNDERHEAVRGWLELFRAIAEQNAREQQFGQTAYTYPGSLGEWLGTAVQIAATVSWQSHWALQPLERLDAHEHPIAEQGRSFLELYGGVLVGALAACDRAVDREADAAAQVELPAIGSVVEVWDEARDEREGLLLSLGRLGDAIWIYAPAGTGARRCCRRSRPSSSRRPASPRWRSPSPTSSEIFERSPRPSGMSLLAT